MLSISMSFGHVIMTFWHVIGQVKQAGTHFLALSFSSNSAPIMYRSACQAPALPYHRTLDVELTPL